MIQIASVPGLLEQTYQLDLTTGQWAVLFASGNTSRLRYAPAFKHIDEIVVDRQATKVLYHTRTVVRTPIFDEETLAVCRQAGLLAADYNPLKGLNG